jgi:heme exporter protein C
MSSLLKNSWKYLGIVLLLYVFSMVLLVPMGPGLDSSEYSENEKTTTVTATGYATHFDSDIRAFLVLEESDITIECQNIEVLNNTLIKCSWNLPDTLPSRSWNLIVSAPVDGNLYLPNALFHEPVVVGGPTERSFSTSIDYDELHKQDLGFHFPYQPRIVESIRNLMLHVPMWFTMFLLMGIGFVNSIKSLRAGPASELHDAKAVSSIRTGIAFGVMGLLTGSLWARFTWGAWWVNDPQLNGAMVTVLIYAGYLILRASISDPTAKTRLSGVYSLFAFIILMILLMVLPRFTESLHPGKGGNPAFSKYDLDSALRLVFYPAVIGWMLVGTWMYTLALRAEKLRVKIQRLQEH